MPWTVVIVGGSIKKLLLPLTWPVSPAHQKLHNYSPPCTNLPPLNTTTRYVYPKSIHINNLETRTQNCGRPRTVHDITRRRHCTLRAAKTTLHKATRRHSHKNVYNLPTSNHKTETKSNTKFSQLSDKMLYSSPPL